MPSPRRLEKDVQSEAVLLLRMAGFTVEEIGRSRPDEAQGWAINDAAATDLNVRHHSWLPGLRVHIELKRDLQEARTMPTSNERRKAAQWASYLADASWIAWDAATVMSAVVETCGALDCPRGQSGIAKICTANGIELYTREQIWEMLTAAPTTPTRGRARSR